jgi:hypothetical protein
MNYILYVSQRNKIVDQCRERSFTDIDPRVLANEKPVRFGRSRLQRHMSYEIMRPMETTTRMSGFFREPREVNSLNVMLQKIVTPSERRTYGKVI